MSDLSMESVFGRPWMRVRKRKAEQVFIADLSQPNLLNIRQTIHLTSTACTRWNVRKSILYRRIALNLEAICCYSILLKWALDPAKKLTQHSARNMDLLNIFPRCARCLHRNTAASAGVTSAARPAPKLLFWPINNLCSSGLNTRNQHGRNGVTETTLHFKPMKSKEVAANSVARN